MIAEAFSRGEFQSAYDHFSETIEWDIIGDKKLTGKKPVVDYCEKILPMMAGSQLISTNFICDTNKMAIEGNCDYTTEDGKVEKVSYCDIYEFSGAKITKITSYLVDKC